MQKQQIYDFTKFRTKTSRWKQVFTGVAEGKIEHRRLTTVWNNFYPVLIASKSCDTIPEKVNATEFETLKLDNLNIGAL